MRNHTKSASAILGILFLVFCVVALIAPASKTPAFWVSFAFTVVAFAVQRAIWKAAFRGEETLKSKFLGLPILYVGIVYLIVQLLVAAVFTVFPMLPLYVCILVCVLIAGLAAASLVATQMGKNETVHVEQTTREKVLFLKGVQAEIEQLARTETDGEVKTALTALTAQVRYSDPMGADGLADLDERIKVKVEELKSSGDKLPLIRDLQLLVSERNQMCKILK